MPAGVDVGGTTVVRYQTPTGQPCPRSLQLDGTVWGTGDCQGCGYCLLLEAAAWPRSAALYELAAADASATRDQGLIVLLWRLGVSGAERQDAM